MVSDFLVLALSGYGASWRSTRKPEFCFAWIHLIGRAACRVSPDGKSYKRQAAANSDTVRLNLKHPAVSCPVRGESLPGGPVATCCADTITPWRQSCCSSPGWRVCFTRAFPFSGFLSIRLPIRGAGWADHRTAFCCPSGQLSSFFLLGSPGPGARCLSI